MLRFGELFKKPYLNIIGMIHVGALPGTPLFQGSLQKIIDNACNEASQYAISEIDGVLIENMHDVPYQKNNLIGPETTAIMTRICKEIRNCIPIRKPCGVQILAGGNHHALAVALAADLQFIRAESFVFGHLADEGWMDACAGELVRFRRNINAEHIHIWCDVKKKHAAHMITQDVSLAETAKAAQMFLADALIITGESTGRPAYIEDLKEIKENCSLPIVIGSGITSKNLENYKMAHAIIVGSSLKYEGDWKNSLDPKRLNMLLEKREQLLEKN